ncbi:MAG: DUF58 domain-containing protein [Anaerolineae bacterium]|nr:DUF58 domain-containing protein [Anaerolineae bacterium]
MSGLASFVLALLLLAAFLRVDFFHYLFYLTVGIVVLGRWWAQRAARAVAYRREYPERVFWGERPVVRLELWNRGYLPVLWLRVHDSLPIELSSPNFYHRVLSLLPRERMLLSYQLDCRRRGYYRLGPLSLEAGDLLGTTRISLSHDDAATMVVYPRIIPLAGLGLPSRTPYGSMRSKQRIFEDPSRVLGVRDYVPGDSLRHVAWKTSAILGRLQVKRYQPAIALDTTILLNLDRADYSHMRVYVASELAIVLAASLANWLVEHRQAVGLCTNGRDPLAEAGQVSTLLQPRKGRGALMRILDLLARIQLTEGQDFAALLRRQAGQLPWGSTLAIVTGRVGDGLFPALAGLRRAGFSVVLYSVDPSTAFEAIRRRATLIGVMSHAVWDEADLEHGVLAVRGQP